MVDIHCHILPGLDDGPDTLEEALKMGEMAIADGITHLVATPHADDSFTFVPDLVRQRRDELQGHFGDRLILSTGCDFHLSYENLEDARRDPRKYTVSQKNYLLVEFADFAVPATLDDALHQLQLAGLSPIITHPERNGWIRGHPARLDRWVCLGCFVQVTADSLLGRFGRLARRAAETWLDADRVHFLASDAHNLTSRPPRLRKAFGVVAKRRGEDVAQALFQDNPLAAFEGRPLPYVPEPPDPESTEGLPRGFRRRKRFLFF